jgi:translation initiation factor 2-alpha kinase 4
MKAAFLDVVTLDKVWGPIAAIAELLAVANDCLNSFPNLGQKYDVRISHSKSKMRRLLWDRLSSRFISR